MAMTRRLLRLTGLIGFAVFGLLGFIVILSLPEEVSRNRRLVRSFVSAASWIDDFSKINGRLPSTDEYKSWAASEPKDVYGVQSVQLLSPSNSQFYQEAVAAFGEPDATGSYVLAMWTGRWNEYYASWAHQSTVNNSPRYYGCVFLLNMFFMVAAFLCWCLAHSCRPATRADEILPARPRTLRLSE